MQASVFLAPFHNGFRLVEVEVGVVAQLFYAGAVEMEAADGGGIDAEPGAQLFEVQVDVLQLFDVMEASQALAVGSDETGNAAAYARYAFQFGCVGPVEFNDRACRVFGDSLEAVCCPVRPEENNGCRVPERGNRLVGRGLSGVGGRGDDADVGGQGGVLFVRQAVYLAEVAWLAEASSLPAVTHDVAHDSVREPHPAQVGAVGRVGVEDERGQRAGMLLSFSSGVCLRLEGCFKGLVFHLQAVVLRKLLPVGQQGAAVPIDGWGAKDKQDEEAQQEDAALLGA